MEVTPENVNIIVDTVARLIRRRKKEQSLHEFPMFSLEHPDPTIQKEINECISSIDAVIKEKKDMLEKFDYSEFIEFCGFLVSHILWKNGNLKYYPSAFDTEYAGMSFFEKIANVLRSENLCICKLVRVLSTLVYEPIEFQHGFVFVLCKNVAIRFNSRTLLCRKFNNMQVPDACAAVRLVWTVFAKYDYTLLANVVEVLQKYKFYIGHDFVEVVESIFTKIGA